MSDLFSFSPPPNPGDTLRRVLVIKLGALGDFIQSLGAMRVVRATHPSARVTLLTTEPFEAFAKACPYFDIVEADGRPSDPKGRADLVRRIRQAGYDMVYDFQNNERTAQYFNNLSGKKLLWSGAVQGASHQHRNPARATMHTFDRLADQLRHAGLEPGAPGGSTGWVTGQDLAPSLDWIRPAFRNPPRFQPEFFSLSGPYMLLIPGSSTDHPEKRWPLDRFAAIAGWVADAGITPVVVGAKAEGDIGAQIARLEPRARNLVGRTDLFQLATLAERAVFAVGGDTGPMHIAAAARTPSIGIFAEPWSPAMDLELQSIWNPQTHLGRSAPRGGPMIVLYANTLAEIQPGDVMRAAFSMQLMPAHAAPPPPVRLAPSANGDAADEPAAEEIETPEADAAPEGADEPESPADAAALDSGPESTPESAPEPAVAAETLADRPDS